MKVLLFNGSSRFPVDFFTGMCKKKICSGLCEEADRRFPLIKSNPF